jgi:hypothetical protein
MALASEIMGRAFEKSYGPFPELDDFHLVEEFIRMDGELALIKTLRGLNAADKAVSEKRNAILIFSDLGRLEIRTYRDSPDALRSLFELEKQFPNYDIVLVRADTTDEVRIAFKNYFSDTLDFVQLIQDGCGKLTGTNVSRPPRERTKKILSSWKSFERCSVSHRKPAWC